MAYKIDYFGYDIYELASDLGSGRQLKTKNVKMPKKLRFKSEAGALKYIAEKYLHTAYHKYDWTFERDVIEEYDNTWILHIIVEKKTHKWATEKMISSWRDGKTELVDLLVNVRMSEVAD